MASYLDLSFSDPSSHSRFPLTSYFLSRPSLLSNLSCIKTNDHITKKMRKRERKTMAKAPKIEKKISEKRKG
jgi:hypothetical protein